MRGIGVMSFDYWKTSAALAGLLVTIASPKAPAQADDTVETVTVTAQRLSEARTGIQTQTGASAYNITAANIEAQPGGENTQLNQVLLQAPSVVQDSFGQFLHPRRTRCAAIPPERRHPAGRHQCVRADA